MRDAVFFTLPASVGLLAQIPPQDSMTQLGIAALSISATVFVWKHFASKEAAATAARHEADLLERDERKSREAVDSADRNRLLEQANALQQQVVELLKSQVDKAEERAHPKNYNRMRPQ